MQIFQCFADYLLLSPAREAGVAMIVFRGRGTVVGVPGGRGGQVRAGLVWALLAGRGSPERVSCGEHTKVWPRVRGTQENLPYSTIRL